MKIFWVALVLAIFSLSGCSARHHHGCCSKGCGSGCHAAKSCAPAGCKLKECSYCAKGGDCSSCKKCQSEKKHSCCDKAADTGGSKCCDHGGKICEKK